MGAFNIPLDFRSPQIESPTQMAGQALSLRQMALQQQLGQQQLQQQQIATQQKQAALRDQQTIQQAYLQNNGDWDATRKSVLGRVNLQTLQQFDLDHLTQQRALAQMQNEQKMKLYNDNMLIGPTAAGLLQLTPEARAAAYPDELKRLQTAGVDTTGFDPSVPPTDDQLRMIAAHSNYLGQLMTAKDKEMMAQRAQEQADRFKAQAAAATADEERKNLQSLREDAARQYYGVNDQETHEQWLQGLNPKIAAEYRNFRNYDEGNQDTFNDMALSAQQRSLQSHRQAQEGIQQQSADTRQQNADTAQQRANQTLTAVALQAYDPDATPAQRAQAQQALVAAKQRYGVSGGGRGATLTPGQQNTQNRWNEAQFQTSSKRVTADMVQKEAQESIASQLESAVRDATAAKKTSFADPRNPNQMITVDQANARVNEARKKATNYANDADLIRKRMGWGGSATTQAPPAPATQAAPAPPPQSVIDGLSVGEHTFRNGQTWRKNPDGSVTFVSGK